MAIEWYPCTDFDQTCTGHFHLDLDPKILAEKCSGFSMEGERHAQETTTRTQARRGPGQARSAGTRKKNTRTKSKNAPAGTPPKPRG